MLKKTLFISSLAAMLLVGCGGTSNSSIDPTTDTTEITVERGPVLGSLVLDAKGNRAVYQSAGKYLFTGEVTYPITAQGGYIDVNRNNHIDAGEIMLTYTLEAAQGDVITLATTVAAQAQIRTLLQAEFGLTDEAIDTQTPSENRVIAALSDELYAYCQDNNLTPLQLTETDTLSLQERIHARINLYEESNQTVAELEASLIEELGIETITENEIQTANQVIGTTQLQDGTGIIDIPLSELTTDQMEDLVFMIEEEKMARDVYLYLADRWGLRIFANIARSEQKHMDALEVLLDRYELTTPSTLESQGVFENADLQALYDQLIAQGELSATEALKVGVLIEETDIADLEEIIDAGVPEDLEVIYQNLLNGSYNHLNAFKNQL